MIEMISKTERKRRKQEKVLGWYRAYCRSLIEGYKSNDYNKIKEAYGRLSSFTNGAMSMCEGGQYSYWHKKFEEEFAKCREEFQQYE
jgi:hypothetical protein